MDMDGNECPNEVDRGMDTGWNKCLDISETNVKVKT